MKEWADPISLLSPSLRAHITDKTIQQWRELHLCLCGCGETVGVRKCYAPGLRKGDYNFFAHKNHILKFYRDADYHAEMSRRAWVKNREKYEIANRKRWSEERINSAGLSILIDQHLTENNITLGTLAERAGVNRGWLGEVRNYKRKEVTKTFFVRVMIAMDEPIPHGYGQYAPKGAKYMIAREEAA